MNPPLPTAPADLLALVDTTPLAPPWELEAYTIDWGQQRPRARRHSTARSAMHDGPRGERIYHRLPSALTGDDRIEVEALSRSGAVRYLRGRTAGLSHDAAWSLVRWAGGDADVTAAHVEAFAGASGVCS